MNNIIDSSVNFQANLRVERLGRNNAKMKNVARNFKIATQKYPNDRLCIDTFGFYGDKSNLEADIPLTEEGMQVLYKSSEEEITKSCVKLFKILKRVVNKSVRVFRSTSYLLDEKNTSLSESDIIKTEKLISLAVSSAQKTEIINKTKRDKILKHIDYDKMVIYP